MDLVDNIFSFFREIKYWIVKWDEEGERGKVICFKEIICDNWFDDIEQTKFWYPDNNAEEYRAAKSTPRAS